MSEREAVQGAHMRSATQTHTNVRPHAQAPTAALTRNAVSASTVVKGITSSDGSFCRDSAPNLMTRTAVAMARRSARMIATTISVTAVKTYAITLYAVSESTYCGRHSQGLWRLLQMRFS